MIRLENDWDEILAPEFNSEYYSALREFLKQEYRAYTVYPDMFEIFSAFKETPFSAVRVVILGQDPYHNPGQAHGMCFSVKPNTQIPASLVNIYKELEADIGCKIPNNGYLTHWARQGVLLLNSVLTVRGGAAASHKNQGWEQFTDRCILYLNLRKEPIVFLLWGGFAKSKAALITNPAHTILTSAHPSPLSAYNGFFGCRHFSKCNQILISQGSKPIDWQIPDC